MEEEIHSPDAIPKPSDCDSMKEPMVIATIMTPKVRASCERVRVSACVQASTCVRASECVSVCVRVCADVCAYLY